MFVTMVTSQWEMQLSRVKLVEAGQGRDQTVKVYGLHVQVCVHDIKVIVSLVEIPCIDKVFSVIPDTINLMNYATMLSFALYSISD